MHAAQFENPKPEKYSDYKNRTIAKLVNRAELLQQAIKSSSLKDEDKIKVSKRIHALFSSAPTVKKEEGKSS